MWPSALTPRPPCSQGHAQRCPGPGMVAPPLCVTRREAHPHRRPQPGSHPPDGGGDCRRGGLPGEGWGSGWAMPWRASGPGAVCSGHTSWRASGPGAVCSGHTSWRASGPGAVCTPRGGAGAGQGMACLIDPAHSLPLHAACLRGKSGKSTPCPAPPSPSPTDLLPPTFSPILLSFQHSREIIHGDLNGGNVLLDASGADARRFTALIGDFGLAQAAKADEAEAQAAGSAIEGEEEAGEGEGWLISRVDEEEPVVYGAVTHQPPERLAEGVLTPAADVYALGVLLWVSRGPRLEGRGARGRARAGVCGRASGSDRRVVHAFSGTEKMPGWMPGQQLPRPWPQTGGGTCGGSGNVAASTSDPSAELCTSAAPSPPPSLLGPAGDVVWATRVGGLPHCPRHVPRDQRCGMPAAPRHHAPRLQGKRRAVARPDHMCCTAAPVELPLACAVHVAAAVNATTPKPVSLTARSSAHPPPPTPSHPCSRWRSGACPTTLASARLLTTPWRSWRPCWRRALVPLHPTGPGPVRQPLPATHAWEPPRWRPHRRCPCRPKRLCGPRLHLQGLRAGCQGPLFANPYHATLPKQKSGRW